MLDGSPVESNNYQVQSQIQQSPTMHKQPQHMNQHVPKHQVLHQQPQQKQQQQLPLQQQSPCQNHQSPLQSQRTTQYSYQQGSTSQRQSPVSPVDTPSDAIGSHKVFFHGPFGHFVVINLLFNFLLIGHCWVLYAPIFIFLLGGRGRGKTRNSISGVLVERKVCREQNFRNFYFH